MLEENICFIAILNVGCFITIYIMFNDFEDKIS